MGRDIAALLKMVEQRDLHRAISPGFEETVTINHLNISSVCKSLVGLCVAEV